MHPTDDPLDRAPLRLLVGPTASGKSELALVLAESAGAEILSMDSMQIYRGLDIGTAKPDSAERSRVRHHLVDVAEPEERYDVQRYLSDARQALDQVFARKGRALFVGGTGFYLAALLRGLFEGPAFDPALRARLEARRIEIGAEAQHAELAAVDLPSSQRIHAHDAKRVVRALEVWEQTGRRLSDWQREWEAEDTRRLRLARIVGVRRDAADLEQRIRRRAEAMMDAGWPEEVLALQTRGGLGESARQALGYREILDWLEGRIGRDAALERIVTATRRFARRQRTWTRKFDVLWLDVAAEDSSAHPEHVSAALRHFEWSAGSTGSRPS